ncbi:hypothetical protein GCM10023340_16050 [Nocardioides marinquilinus]|uniref:Uncharacterized protein n=1 Tax=Nocardioides marinquilinus TaxID=1210400 RepID=A0ABP9PKP8_9ACTN
MADEPRWEGYRPSETTPPAEQPGQPEQPEQPRWPLVDAPKARPVPPVATRARAPVLGVLLLALVIVVAVVVSVALAVRDDDDRTDADAGTDPAAVPSPAPTQPPDVLSDTGLADLVDAVRTERGGTEVFDATLSSEYAVLDLPVDATTRRYESWYWDGELRSNDARGTARYGRIDLATLDAAVVRRLLTRVARLVEDPTSTYVIVRGPSELGLPDDGIRVSAYASNEFGETAYLAADARGRVIRRYLSTEE